MFRIIGISNHVSHYHYAMNDPTGFVYSPAFKAVLERLDVVRDSESACAWVTDCAKLLVMRICIHIYCRFDVDGFSYRLKNKQNILPLPN